MIKIIKYLVLILLVVFTSSCSYTVFYYNRCFGIKDKKQFTFYHNSGGDYYPDNEEGWESLKEKVKNGEEVKPFQYAPALEVGFEYTYTPEYYTFKYKSESDTLFLIQDSLQEVSFLPVGRDLLSRRSMSNGIEYFSTQREFFIKYIKDSVILFLDYPPKLMDIFYFYPKHYQSDMSFDSDGELHTPLIIGFLKGYGIPIYLKGYHYIIKDYEDLLKCYQIQEIKFVSKRKIKEILY